MMSFRITMVTFLALASFAGPSMANLVGNPGFETGDFTDWTLTGDGISIDSVFPHTGTYDAAFSALSADPNAGVLSQALTTTTGQGYTIGFALMDEAGFSSDTFTIGFGAFTTTVTGDMAPSTYVVFAFTAPGADISSTITTLSFQGLQTLPTNQDWNLDDVSVTGVPEPATWALLVVAFAGLAARLLLRTALRASVTHPGAERAGPRSA